MLERGKMDRDLVEFVVIDQLVPKEHLLRKIDAAVDFTQLYEMVEPLYCEDNGRPSIDTVVLFKMVLIQRLFRTGIENAAALRLEDSYKGLSSYVITPVLDRYGVPEREKPYLMAFYLHGLMAVISEWLKNDCAEPVEYIAGVIQRCVKRRGEGL